MPAEKRRNSAKNPVIRSLMSGPRNARAAMCMTSGPSSWTRSNSPLSPRRSISCRVSAAITAT